jgi:uncharacterized protein YhbP (UPF0306 family)
MTEAPMKHSDEPVFDSDTNSEDSDDVCEPTVRSRVQQLVTEQPYAVLCVQGGGQPYGALVSYAFSDDLRHAVFVTPRATRKFRLLGECKHVALVIDNRSSKGAELMEIEAVTATGHAHLLEHSLEFEQWASLLVARHSYLASFVRAETCALFRIDVVRFLHVVRFQEVCQWVPNGDS